MYDLLIIGGGTFAIVLALTIVLGLASKLGKSGEDVINYCSQAPGLDFVIIALIVLPWVLGGLGAGWSGLASAGAGQVAASQVWVLWHSWICRQSRPEVGINAYLSQRYGWWRNHLALWITAVVLPMFFLIRAVQVLIYPLLVWLLNFKSYDHSEWINVSRQKFEGLVGHDLMWCLYCDWMTGVYSLGAEMLRNVESFWCPIRFYNGKKCENCSLDFPAIDQGWVTAEGTMPEVVNTLDATIPRDRPWRWSEASDNAANKV